MTDSVGTDLGVDLCGLRLDHPFLLGSGGLGESAGTLAPFQRTAAAVVTRTLRRHTVAERRAFPRPHLALGPRRQWMLNCEWGNLQPFDYWQGTGLPAVRRSGPVIVSVSGRDIDDCVDTCRRLDGQAPLFEINVSCSHAGALYGRLTDDAGHISRLLDRLKAAVTTPVMVKLGWSPVLGAVARAAAEAGADAVATTNSIGPGLDLDVHTGRPRLGAAGGIGGLSGRSIFPIALECVHQVVEAVDVPVVGVGGVATAADALKMIMVGATCVQVYTEAFLRGPALFERLRGDLAGLLAAEGYRSARHPRGVARPHLRAPSRTDPVVPAVLEQRCQPCGQCARICPADAIDVGATARIDAESCIGCGICLDVCPPALDAIRW
jgi:dihydroorotate dehydrogenase (fumarate)